MKVISLAGITCDHETVMLILIMYLKKYLKVFENVKYLKKVFKYKYNYFSFQLCVCFCSICPGNRLKHPSECTILKVLQLMSIFVMF